MKKNFILVTGFHFLCFVMLTCFCQIAVSSQASTGLSTILDAMHSYSAECIQVTYGDSNQVIQKSSGKIQFVRPGKFRWEIIKPNHQIIIANDSTLWVYDVDLEQVTKQRLNKQADQITPARILSSSAKDLAKDFHITMLSAKAPAESFSLKPLSNTSMFESLSLSFNNNKLVGMSLVNNLGQLNKFQFYHIRVNDSISHALFNFKPPAGVDVIQGGLNG